MEFRTAAGLRIYYESEETETADLINTSCEKSVQLLMQRWGLAVPPACRIYVMTSWQQFYFRSTPWTWKFYLMLFYPLLARQIARTWPYIGGWSVQYGNRKVVGVKPVRFMETADRSLGKQIFVEGTDLKEKVQVITCHELTHAFTFHLKLPTWLQEGLATLAMDHYLNRCIVREDTLSRVDQFPGGDPRRKQQLRVTKPQDMIDAYIRGYWLTRYLDETRPILLKEVLSRRYKYKELVRTIASAYEKDPDTFWPEMMAQVKAYFQK